MKHQKTASRAHRGTRTASPPPRKARDTSDRHVVLLDRSGNTVRRCTAPRSATYLLNLRDGHYYDLVNPTTFVQRGAKVGYLSVECPTCDAWIGWACGKSHVDPIHRARIVEVLKVSASKKAAVQP